MAFLHRKLLHKSMEKFVEQPCTPTLDHNSCNELPPLPPLLLLPPPQPQPSSNSISLFLIVMFCGLAVSFSFICYLTLAAIHRRRQTTRESRDVTHDDFVNEDLGPIIQHPIWLISTVGLDQSQIESIRVFKYRKEEGLNTDCSVCLSEFEDDESLRLLPKCGHAFHVSCIDTWLRSHKNCPLCRALVIMNDHDTIETNLIDTNTSEETQGGDYEIDHHHHVVEVENNGEILGKSSSSGARVQSDLADLLRVQKQEYEVLRRSVSMNETSLASIVNSSVANVSQERHSSSSSCSQLIKSEMANSKSKSGHYKSRGSSSSMISIHRVMKSSSFRKSLRKAGSFTKRSSSSSSKSFHNRSY